MMKTKLLSVIATLAFLGVASSASATIVNLTYTGIVVDAGTGESDGSGLFGPAGSSLVGDTYTAVYVFNTALGGSVYDMNTANNLTIYGGSVFLPAISTSPSLGATITINGISVFMANTAAEGGMLLCTYLGCGGMSSGYNEVYSIVQFSDGGGGYMENQLYNYGPDGVSTTDIATLNFSVDFSDTDASRGWFEMGSTAADLLPLTVSVSTTPLPPPWTMMLAGLAGFGLLSYRRKKMALAVAQVAA